MFIKWRGMVPRLVRWTMCWLLSTWIRREPIAEARLGF